MRTQDPSKILLCKIQGALAIVIIGLVLSGLSTFPLLTETFWLEQWFGNNDASNFSMFIRHIREGVVYTHQHYPFLFYGLDWLGFAHFAIALAFIAPFKSPTQHIATIHWGLQICGLCIPAIFLFGWMHKMPIFWSFIDCLFPLIAAIPLALASLWSNDLIIEHANIEHANSKPPSIHVTSTKPGPNLV